MTSQNTYLKKFDDLTRLNHHQIHPEYEVYHLGEYTPRASYTHSPMNQLIKNYKKEMNRHDKPEWRYKNKAIHEIGRSFRNGISNTELSPRSKKAIRIPIPPSHHKSDENYDDRNLQMLTVCDPKTDIRELIIQIQTRPSLHSNTKRDWLPIFANYTLNPESNQNVAEDAELWLFDDVLTTGATIRAATEFLKNHYPGRRIVCFVVARAVYPDVIQEDQAFPF